jgi:hypothetical protein
MSNQRAGKMHSAGAKQHTYQEMYMVNFFESCAKVLENSDDPSGSTVAFYFEQIVDHMREGGSLPADHKDIQRMFGL